MKERFSSYLYLSFTINAYVGGEYTGPGRPTTSGTELKVLGKI